MSTARVTFHQILQDSQELGSDNEHMISRVFFDLEVGGERHEGLHADVKQPVGSSFEDDPLEVSAPSGYDGPFNFAAFREVTEEYYRRAIGSRGSAIQVGEGASNIRMHDNLIGLKMVAEFEVREG